jgi:hypothetical protein
MACTLRVDDFPGTKPAEFWRHNLESFKLFDEVLADHVSNYVLGVIPRHTTQEQIDWLAENPRVEAALHGILHDEKYLDEFKEFETEDDIYRKIMSTIPRLQNINGSGRITSYIAPHNVISLKTAKALKRAGFTTLFSGPGADSKVINVIEKESILEVKTSQFPYFYGRTDEIMKCPEFEEYYADASALPGYALTLHFPWETNIGFEHLETFMKKVGYAFWSES